MLIFFGSQKMNFEISRVQPQGISNRIFSRFKSRLHSAALQPRPEMSDGLLFDDPMIYHSGDTFTAKRHICDQQKSFIGKSMRSCQFPAFEVPGASITNY
jgi:hypothetical protein